MVDEIFYNNGIHGLSKRMSVKESLLILLLHDSYFSRRSRMRYFLGEMNMEKYGDRERGRGTWTSFKLGRKWLQLWKATGKTLVFLYINKISMSFCLSVCPQTTPREIDMNRWIIHHWMRAFSGTNVIYFSKGSDYLVRTYTKKTNFGPPKFLDFFRCTKCRNFFL